MFRNVNAPRHVIPVSLLFPLKLVSSTEKAHPQPSVSSDANRGNFNCQQIRRRKVANDKLLLWLAANEAENL